MLRLLLTAACAVPLCCVPLVPAAGGDPPLRLLLRIDGADHEVVDGQEITIAVAGKEVRAKATVHPNRQFEGAGVRFDFPRDMAFAAEPGPALSQWTLDGDDCVIIVNAFAKGDAAELAADLLARTLRANDEKAAPAKACTVSLGGKDHAALRGRARIAGVVLEITSVWLVADGKPVVLVLNDSLGDDGKASAETTRVLELLKTTFAFRK